MTMLLTPENRHVEIVAMAPAAQASISTAAVVAGSAVDARPWDSLAYTIAIATQAVTWWVYGAHADNFSDEVIVDGPSNVAAAATDTYTVTPPPYAYYRVKIQDQVSGTHGTATVRGILK